MPKSRSWGVQFRGSYWQKLAMQLAASAESRASLSDYGRVSRNFRYVDVETMRNTWLATSLLGRPKARGWGCCRLAIRL
jgi:hypothetical protein